MEKVEEFILADTQLLKEVGEEQTLKLENGYQKNNIFLEATKN